jgi:hypothetical protein
MIKEPSKLLCSVSQNEKVENVKKSYFRCLKLYFSLQNHLKSLLNKFIMTKVLLKRTLYLMLSLALITVSCERTSQVEISTPEEKSSSISDPGISDIPKLSKAQYEEYSVFMFTELQSVVDYAYDLAGYCILGSSSNEWMSIMSFYVWENYPHQDYDSIYSAFAGSLDAWAEGNQPYTLLPWQEEIQVEILDYLDALPTNNYYQNSIEYLDEKFDEVYEMQINLREQDQMLSSIMIMKGWTNFIEQNPNCFGLTDAPDWRAIAKCVTGVAAGHLSGSVLGAGSGAAIASALALSATGAGAFIVGVAAVGAMSGALIASGPAGCWDL